VNKNYRVKAKNENEAKGIYKSGMVKRDNYGKRNGEKVQEEDKKRRKKGE